MLDVEQGSLEYFLSRPADGRWAGLLRVLGEELATQMSAPEIRAFFAVLGRRWARSLPLDPDGALKGSDLKSLEQAVNAVFATADWGWVRIRDLGSSIEFQHACAPFRCVFGSGAMDWAPGLLEGIYDEWLRGEGADRGLVLKQVGRAEGPADVLRFRLAAADYFS